MDTHYMVKYWCKASWDIVKVFILLAFILKDYWRISFPSISWAVDFPLYWWNKGRTLLSPRPASSGSDLSLASRSSRSEIDSQNIYLIVLCKDIQKKNYSYVMWQINQGFWKFKKCTYWQIWPWCFKIYRPSKIFTGPGLLAVIFHKPWLKRELTRSFPNPSVQMPL